jgi:hypothetical protein
MEPLDFLAVVLPSEGHGYYCAANLLRKSHNFTDTLAGLKAATDKLTLKDDASGILNSKEAGAFFALATYETKNSRKVANAAYLRCIYIDIDCGGGDKCYDSKKEGVAALAQFLETTGLNKLGTPYMVDSGGGVHCYFPFPRDLPVAEWLPIATAFKATATRLGFKIDMTVTDDAARVLRIPESNNYKLDYVRRVKMKLEGSVFDIDAFVSCLDAPAEKKVRLPALQVKTPVDPLMQALTQQHQTFFKDIMVKTVAGSGCGQIAHYIENASADGMEPLWRACLSIAMKCEDGAKSCAKLTAMHPYTEERMQQKLDTIAGPYSCAKFDTIVPGICGNCRHNGRITNPLALGRRIARTPTIEIASEVMDESEYAEAAPQETGFKLPYGAPPMPVAPDYLGFFYSRDTGALYRTVNVYDKKGVIVETKEVMVVPYPFYMENVQNELDSHRATFVAIRGDRITRVTVNTNAISAPDLMVKEFGRQNIMASGKGNDIHLYTYVRDAMEHASATDKTVRVPPRYGWQVDDSFAIGNEVIGQNDSYLFTSEKLSNLIACTEPKGTIEEWRKYPDMLQKKRAFGLIGASMVAFASPLMRYVGAGTPAMLTHACHAESGHGKSTAIHLAASVWGNPVTYHVKPDTSARTMLQRCGMLGSIPFLCDEITAVAREDKNFMPKLVYSFAQGGHKLKGSGSANAELPDDMQWAMQGLVTSNEPLMEKMLTSRDTTSHGELMRILEWHPSEALEWTDAERTLKGTLANNYGVAGRKFAQWLVRNQDVAERVTLETIERWRKKIGATDVERYWTVDIGAKLAGAILCGKDYADVFDYDIKALSLEYASWVKKARALLGANVRGPEDILNAYTKEFHGSFIRFDKSEGKFAAFADGSTPANASTRGRVAGRVESNIKTGYVEYFIPVTLIKKYVSDRNISYETFKQGLIETEDELTHKRTMIIMEVRKDLLSKTGGPVLRELCLHVSRVLEDDQAQAGQVPVA